MTHEELAAHTEIQQVLFRYCRGVDRGDKTMLASVYHPDAIDRHGAWEGPGRAFGDYLVPAMDAANLSSQHHITNSLIDLDGARARVESYFIALHPLRDEAGARHAFVCGRYLDRFELRDGAWKIAERQVVIDISRALDAAVPWPGAAAFPSGARREADPSWALFKG